MSDEPEQTRIVITGDATAEEVAAVVAAVAATTGRRKPTRPRLAWAAAARVEATGHRIIAAPWELPPA